MSYNFQPFLNPSLQHYEFSICSLDYPDQIYGYDQQGHVWRGEALLTMRQQGLIVKEFPKRIITMGEKGTMLGDICESPNGTYIAHSSYFFGDMNVVEVNGFKNEFYAVRYLHQVIIAVFPSSVETPFPNLPWEHEKQVKNHSEKAVLENQLNSLIGHIQECYAGIWLAHSCYCSESLYGIKAVGFISEFYAIRYLYQIAEVAFPDLFDVDEFDEMNYQNLCRVVA